MKKYLLILLLSGFNITKSGIDQERLSQQQELLSSFIEKQIDAIKSTFGENSVSYKIFETKNVREAIANLSKLTVLNQAKVIRADELMKSLGEEHVLEIFRREGLDEYHNAWTSYYNIIGDKFLKLNQEERLLLLFQLRLMVMSGIMVVFGININTIKFLNEINL